MPKETIRKLGLKVPAAVRDRFRRVCDETGLSGPEAFEWMMRIFENDPGIAKLKEATIELNSVRAASGLAPVNTQPRRGGRPRKQPT